MVGISGWFQWCDGMRIAEETQLHDSKSSCENPAFADRFPSVWSTLVGRYNPASA